MLSYHHTIVYRTWYYSIVDSSSAAGASAAAGIPGAPGGPTAAGGAWVGFATNKYNPSKKSGFGACISSRITTVIHVNVRMTIK